MTCVMHANCSRWINEFGLEYVMACFGVPYQTIYVTYLILGERKYHITRILTSSMLFSSFCSCFWVGIQLNIILRFSLCFHVYNLLCVTLGQVSVLEHVNISVKANEVVAIVRNAICNL